jgi:hypothetical protein
MCWRCACFEFNSWGVPCRHIVIVMIHGDSRPDDAAFDCYFRQLWWKNLKQSGGVIDAPLPIRSESTLSRPPSDTGDSNGSSCESESLSSNVFHVLKHAADELSQRFGSNKACRLGDALTSMALWFKRVKGGSGSASHDTIDIACRRLQALQAGTFKRGKKMCS